jgi:hypothetical protein
MRPLPAALAAKALFRSEPDIPAAWPPKSMRQAQCHICDAVRRRANRSLDWLAADVASARPGGGAAKRGAVRWPVNRIGLSGVISLGVTML